MNNMFRLEKISDSSLNIMSLINQFEFKKWKTIVLDSSLNPIQDVSGYMEDNNYNLGILVLDDTNIDPQQIITDVSGNKILNAFSIPLELVWKGIYELRVQNQNLESKITNLENLVSQLIAIVDPSIS